MITCSIFNSEQIFTRMISLWRQLRPYRLQIRHPSLEVGQIFSLFLKIAKITKILLFHNSEVKEEHDISWGDTVRDQEGPQLKSLVNKFHDPGDVLFCLCDLFFANFADFLLVDDHETRKVLEFLLCDFNPLVNLGLFERS